MSNGNEHLRGYKKASEVWDLERLFADLGKVRGSDLPETPKELLCLLLLGNSPKEIADKLKRSEGAVRTELSKNLYPYIIDVLGSDSCTETNGKSGKKKINWTKVLVSLMYKGYRKKTIIIKEETTKEITLEIGSDFAWRIKETLGSMLKRQPQNRLEVKSTDYNRIYIKETTKIYFDGKLQIEARWEGQFREDAPPGLKLLLKTIFSEKLYKGGGYIEWVDAYGQMRSSFGLSLDDQRNLHLTSPDVWVSPCSVPKAKFLEGIAQAFPNIQVRFHQPLKKLNLLANLDAANQIFQDLCREKYAQEKKRGRNLPKLEILNLDTTGGQMKVTVRET